MTAPQSFVSPWVRMAQDAAREWFADHPDAPRADFMAWAESYEVDQVLRAGFGWQPGAPASGQVQEALDAAWTGLMAARDTEARRRGSRNTPPAAPDGPVEPLAAPGGVSGRAAPWWDEEGAA